MVLLEISKDFDEKIITEYQEEICNIEGYNILLHNQNLSKELNYFIKYGFKDDLTVGGIRYLLKQENTSMIFNTSKNTINNPSRTEELKLTELLTKHVSNFTHIFCDDNFRPGEYSNLQNEGYSKPVSDNWIDTNEKERFILLCDPVKAGKSDYKFEAFYLCSRGDDDPKIMKFDLLSSEARREHIELNRMKFTMAPKRIHPSRLHDILSDDTNNKSITDYLENKLPLAIIRYPNGQLYCLCRCNKNKSIIIYILNYTDGITNSIKVSQQKIDDNYVWDGTLKSGLHKNPDYNWLLNKLEVHK